MPVPLVALALNLWAGTAVGAPDARSGTYDGLVLVVAGRAVGGVFADQRGLDEIGGGLQFTCTFLLRGTLAGDRAKVETWFPGDRTRIPGELVFKGDGAGLTLAEDHGGCPMTSGSMVGHPFSMSRDGAADGSGWVGVALVTAKRAVLRPAPEAAPPRAPYLVKSDPVAILERRDGWVRATYRGGTKPVTGWLPASDLAIEMP